VQQDVYQPVQTAILFSAPGITYGDNGIVYVTVGATGATPDGTVQLSVDGGSPLTQALAAGSCTFTIPAGLNAGSHSLSVSYAAQDGFLASSATGTLTVGQRAVTVTADATSKIYGDPDPVLTYHITSGSLVNGDSFSGSLTRKPGETRNATPYLDLPTYPIYQNTLALSSNYILSYVGANFTINPAPVTVTADNAGKIYGDANPTFTVSYSGFKNGETLATSGVTGSPSLTTTATASSPVGAYGITAAPGSLTAGNYTFVLVNGTLTVNPAILLASPVAVSARAGAPFSGAVATFTNADPFGTAASYSALIGWGDGSTSAGVISGTGSTLTVTGTHTYADPVNEFVSVTISHNLGYTTTATVVTTAAVTSLGLGVVKGLTGAFGFWNGGGGQALIKSFNGGSTATALANWLAATFPNLYGASAGANNLTGKSNAQVAAFDQTLFHLGGTRAQAQVLATALNVYATTLSLGGTAGQAYGFSVSATGLGARSYNVGNDGAAFGVANNTTLNVFELLLAVNKKAVKGVLYNGDGTLQAQCADLFNSLDQTGSIG